MHADSAQKVHNLLLINKLAFAQVRKRSTLLRQIFALNVVLTLSQMLPELHVFAYLASTNLEIHVFQFNNAMPIKILSITNVNASMGSLELGPSVLKPVV